MNNILDDIFHFSAHIIALVALVIACFAITGHIHFKNASIDPTDIQKDAFYRDGSDIKVNNLEADSFNAKGDTKFSHSLEVTGTSTIGGNLEIEESSIIKNLTVNKTLNATKVDTYSKHYINIFNNHLNAAGTEVATNSYDEESLPSGSIIMSYWDGGESITGTPNRTITLPPVSLGYKITLIQVVELINATGNLIINCGTGNVYLEGSYVVPGTNPKLNSTAVVGVIANGVAVTDNHILTVKSNNDSNFGKGGRIEFLGISATQWLVSGYGGKLRDTTSAGSVEGITFST